MGTQEIAALLIVGTAALIAVRRLYRSYGVAPLSSFLLKRGYVSLAMRVREQGKKSNSACSNDCSCD